MNIDILSQIKSAENLKSNLVDKFGLKYNPFPRAGIANLNDIPQNRDNFSTISN